MAKDDGNEGLFGKGDVLNKASEAVKAQGRALSETTEMTQKYSQTIIPALEKTANFGDRAKRTAEDVRTLNDKIKEGALNFAKYADATLGSGRTLNEFRNIARGAADELVRLTSLTATYNRLLKEVRTGQERFTKSMQFNTGAVDQASKGLQRTINLTHAQYKISSKLVNKYKIDQKEAMEIQEAARKQFTTQINAYKDNIKVMERLTEDALIMNRVLGIDAPKYMQYLNDRMRATNMTLKQAQNETMQVAMAFDQYKKLLEKMPGAFQRATVSQQDFVRTIEKASEAFKMGNFNAGAFAKALVPLQMAGKAAGLNVNAINELGSGFVTMLQKLGHSDLSSLFGVQSAQEILGRIDEYATKSTGNTKKSLEFIGKRLRSGQMNEIVALQSVLQTMAGDPRMVSMLMTRFGKLDTQIKTAHIQAISGIAPIQAQVLAEQMGPGSETFKQFQNTSDMSTKEYEAQQEANRIRKKMEDLLGIGMTPQQKMYREVLDLATTINKITLWLQDKWYVALIAAGASLYALVAKTAIQVALQSTIARNTSVMAARGIGGGGLPTGPAGRAGRAASVASTGATVASTATAAKAAGTTAAVAAPATAAAASKTGILSRAAGATKGAWGRMGGMGGIASKAGHAYVIGKSAYSIYEGVKAGQKTKGTGAHKFATGSQVAGEGMLEGIRNMLFIPVIEQVIGKKIEPSKWTASGIKSLLSDEQKRMLGKDQSLPNVISQSEFLTRGLGAMAPLASGISTKLMGEKWSMSRTGEQREILKKMGQERRNIRVGVTEQEYKEFKDLKERVESGKKLTKKQKEYVKARSRDMELYEKEMKSYRKESVEDVTLSGIRSLATEKEKITAVKDPQERARLAMRELFKTGSFSDVGGARTLKEMLKGESDDVWAEAKLERLLAKMGVSKEHALAALPSELKAARIRRVAKGQAEEGLGGVTKEETSAFQAMMARRETAGLSGDALVTSAAIAAGKRTGTGQEFKIKVEGGSGEELPQQGKLNNINNTIEYELPRTKLVMGFDNINKGINQLKADNPGPTNSSKQ